MAPERTNLDKPLFSVPQHSHFKIESLVPLEGSKRLPQSVQKTSDPIADISSELRVGESRRKMIF
jgi:hypothetical protein